MNFSGINYESLADGEGIRVSFFVSGCSIRCEGCFNQSAWDFSAGQTFSTDILTDVEEHLKKDYVRGITILGGEPLDNRNTFMTFRLASLAKSLNKDVWIYTGYTLDELDLRSKFNGDIPYILRRYTDVLVEGPFISDMRDVSLAFRGSSNQRIIDVQKSLDSGQVVLYQLHS